MRIEQDVKKQELAMCLAVGQSLMAWANVELQLQMMFGMYLQHLKPRVGWGIWESVTSFEARLKILNATFDAIVDDDLIKKKWHLIFKYTIRLAAMRNQIVHSTMVQLDGNKIVLQPFFSMPSRHEHLSIEEVNKRSMLFAELNEAISWIHITSSLHQRQDIACRPPPPNLILQLEKQANQSGARTKSRPSKSGS